MPPIAKLIASVLLFASIFTTTINLSASNKNSIDDKPNPSQTSETKKVLKKKLSLEYTHPKFESELSKDQKDAILKALKKWKGQLPIDNIFTVTSISDLKTDTVDIKSKHKKTKKETPNAKVIYMWARSTNPNWPAGRIPTGEESEEGDPRFIRTPFNILLKQTKNGKNKASIERDVEVKTESEEIVESSMDDKIYQDLFGTNIADNSFTSTKDILIEPNEIISTSTSSISVTNTSLSSTSHYSVQSSNSQSSLSSNLAPLNTLSSSISNLSSFSSSTKSIGLLESILSFGSVKASAGEFDYSWPWKNGEQWYPVQGWHQCETFNAVNGYTNYVGSPSGCALDLSPYNGASNDILAPVGGTITRACYDTYQGMYKFDQMSILHISSNSMNINNGVYVKKSDKIGAMFSPPVSPRDKNGYFVSNCGLTKGPHIHIKFPSILYSNNSFNIDGVNISGGSNYNPTLQSNGTYQTSYLLTSQNTPPVNPITDPNINSVQPAQANYMKVMDNGCQTADNSRVYIWDRANNNCQKIRYQHSNNTITNPYGKCLDGGDVYNNSSNRWIRFSTCNNGNSQKWKQDDNGRIWSLQINSSNNAMCIEYYSLDNNQGLDVNPCNSNQGQKWYFDLGITREAVPSGATITDSNINSVLPPQADWRWAMDFRCGINNDTQVVMKARDNGNCQKMRYNSNNTITNAYGKCLDAGDINNPSNKWLRFSSCYGTNNQKWKQDNGGRIWSLVKNNSNQTVCIEYNGLSDQSGVVTNPCNNNQSQKWYFDVGLTREEVPSIPPPISNYKPIKSFTNSSYGFNIYGGSDYDQAPVKLWTISGNANELFSFEPSGEIKNKISNKCLDAGNVNDATNRWLRINFCTGSSNQKFYQDGSYRIHVNANTNLCIDSANGNTQGSTLYLYPCHSNWNQQWQLN